MQSSVLCIHTVVLFLLHLCLDLRWFCFKNSGIEVNDALLYFLSLICEVDDGGIFRHSLPFRVSWHELFVLIKIKVIVLVIFVFIRL
jgi:hypothetical protein